jgi:putative ABC transport system ATP-binding protein
MAAIIALREVSKHYLRGSEDLAVLSDFTLDVEERDFVAIMGPSGSGKTTLLNLIGGLDTPSSGQISVAGKRLDALSGAELARWRARHVGFIFQFYNLMPALTAARNVELPLLLTNLSGAERKRRVAAALELVGLADRHSHKPGELSGGQQQRVAIARALIADPSLLVCDEPTGDLDRHTAEEILTLLQTLNRDYGKTIIMVTHDPKAARYATHQLYVDKGRLARVESTASA